jgi:hypothetical protein
MLSKKVIAEDHRLEKESQRATEALAQLRWHWTLDESNPDRVSIREYAQQVGRNHATIIRMVNGYVEWASGDSRVTTDLHDVIALQRFGKDRRSVVEQYSKKTGVAPGNTVGNSTIRHDKAIQQAEAIAKQRAVEKGTSIAQEAAKAVEWVLKEKEHAQRQEDRRQVDKNTTRSQAASNADNALRHLQTMARKVKGVKFNKADREYLLDYLEKIHATADLIALEINGESGTDWDAALAGLTGGQA